MPIAGQKPLRYIQGLLEFFAVFQLVCVFLPRFLAQPCVAQNHNLEMPRLSLPQFLCCTLRNQTRLRDEVLTVVEINISVFLDVTSCVR